MRFGPVPVGAAAGTVLAHTTRIGGRVLRKGVLLGAADCAVLRDAGLAEVVVAVPEPGDVPEDAAAVRVADAVAGQGLRADPPGAGRVNLRAAAAGLLRVRPATIDALNRLHEAVTLATLPPFAPVRPGQVVATIKIIPFAAPERAIAAWEAVATADRPLALAAFRPHRAALVQTVLPSLAPRALQKARDATGIRLAAAGSTLLGEWRCGHTAEEIAAALGEALRRGADLLLVAGASAIVDRRDVVPDGVERAGGTVEHLGAPLDPGNLLLLGRIGAVPLLGLPGCARSTRPNGIDLVLRRVLAGLAPAASDIMGMGVGGLLAEAPPRVRRGAAGPGLAAPGVTAPRVAAIVLAAGQGTRMGANKLLLDAGGGGTLLERAVGAALASRAATVVVVLGHEAGRVRAVLEAGFGDRAALRLVEHPGFRDGLSGSLRCGLAAVQADADAALVLLGDMPEVGPALIDRVIDGFDPASGREIVLPAAADGRLGHPVLWGRRFFTALRDLDGDRGGRALVEAHPGSMHTVPVADEGAFLDLDTPDALADWRAARDRRDQAGAPPAAIPPA